VLVVATIVHGETAPDLLASVLVREADLGRLPPNLNPRLPELIKRCLEKNPKQRWQAVGDLRVEVDTIASAPRSGLGVATAVPVKPLWRRAVPAVLASVIVGVLSSSGTWLLTRSVGRRDVVRFSFALGEGQQFTNPGRHLVAISPDGKRVAYAANSRLYVRLMSELQARPIPGTEDPTGVTSPIFSPDGQSIVFFAGATLGTGGAIKKIAVTAGTAVTICAAANPLGMSWDRGSILLGEGNQGIMRVSDDGGKPEVVARVNVNEQAHGPQMLPDGQSLLFTVASGTAATRWDTARIVVQRRSGEPRTLIEGGSDGRYVPTGHLVYALGGTVFAVPFDARRLEVRGGPAPIIEGVRRAVGNLTGSAHFSFSGTGSLIYVPGPVSASQVLAVFDRTGTLTPLNVPPGFYQHARISPDGKRAVFSIDDSKETNVWIYELNGTSPMRRLTFGGNNRFPIWTSDGQRIAFQSDREKDLGIWWQRADSSGSDAERLTRPDEGTSHIPESWSPIADEFLYTVTKGSRTTLWTFSVRDKKGDRFDRVESSWTSLGSMFSPNGRWVTYYSNEDGSPMVYAQPFPPTGDKVLVSRGSGVVTSGGGGGARHPIWSPDGKELFYSPNVGLFEVVAVQTRPTLTVANPTALPVAAFLGANLNAPRNYDLFPDGKRFITVVPADQPQTGNLPAPEIRIVENWFTELQQRVPTR
jgi:serine/threonine-protein kinase